MPRVEMIISLHGSESYSRQRLLLALVLDGGTLEATGPAGGNESDLLARGGIPPHRRRMTNVLVITTTMRMLHRVHGHTTHLQQVPVYFPGLAWYNDRLAQRRSAGTDVSAP